MKRKFTRLLPRAGSLQNAGIGIGILITIDGLEPG
jgi:hypothetical protein